MSTVVYFSNLVHKICLEMICEMSERMTGRNSGREPGPGMVLFSFDLFNQKMFNCYYITSRINKPGRDHTTTGILKYLKVDQEEMTRTALLNLCSK
jgi:hypothetical protein